MNNRQSDNNISWKIWMMILTALLCVYILYVAFGRVLHPLVSTTKIETIEDYESYEMNEVEQMIATFFATQTLNGKIQLTNLTNSDTGHPSHQASFNYLEAIEGTVFSIPGKISVAEDYRSLENHPHYYAKDAQASSQNVNIRWKEPLSAYDMDHIELFQELKHVTWQQESALSKVKRAQQAFEQLLQEGFTTITAQGVLTSDLSQAYYDEVDKNATSQEKQDLRGFYRMDMDWLMETSDALITIRAKWQLPTNQSTNNRQRYKEELLFALQTMNYEAIDNGVYKVTFVETSDDKNDTEKTDEDVFYLVVKFGELVYFRSANQIHDMRKTTFHPQHAPLERTLQERIVRHFISSYQWIDEITVVAIERMDTISDNVYRATFKVNNQFFIEYDYEPATPQHFEKGVIIEPHAVYTLNFNAVDLDSPEMQERMERAIIRYLQ